MRTTTAALRRQIAEAEEADERIARDHERELAFLDKLERAFEQRFGDLQKALDETMGNVKTEIAVIRDGKLKIIAELRGHNLVQTHAPQPRSLPAFNEATPAGDAD